MKKSKILKLDRADLLKGLFIAFISALLTGVYELFQIGSAFDWVSLKPVLFVAIAAALSYIIKNWLTNSEGELLTKELKK